jgi:cytochrome c oxidase subunit 2
MFALSACGNNKNNNVSSPSASAPVASSPAASQAAGGGETKEVTINATNWKFDQDEIKAKVGDTLKLTLNNTQGAHGIEISDLGVKLKNGETQEIKLDKAGTYEFHCSIQCGQGHDNMTGFIVVE